MNDINNEIFKYNNRVKRPDVIVITSATEFNKGFMSTYILRDNHYLELFKTECLFGRNGLTNNKVEGDGKTPIGQFGLGIAFGVNEFQNYEIEYKKITETMHWVDDINSVYYNKLIDTSLISKDFSSAEHIIDYPVEYEYAISVEHNTNPIISGKGSAIFLHCFSNPPKPTSGCISIKSSYMQMLLNKLTTNSIIIINKAVWGYPQTTWMQKILVLCNHSTNTSISKDFK